MSFTLNCSGYEPIGDFTQQEICYNGDKNLNLTVYGFKRSTCKLFCYHLFSIILLCLPYAILSWFPKIKNEIKYQKCLLQDATLVLVVDKNGNHTLTEIRTESTKLPHVRLLRYFIYQYTKYVWLPHEQIFGETAQLCPFNSIDDYLDNTVGLFDVDYIDLLKLYGPNKIEVEVKSYWRLFLEEILNPFYYFQAFSVFLWCFDHYIIYAGCVFILTLLSIVTALLGTRKQSVALRNLVESAKCHEVTVIRRNLLQDDLINDVDPSELVPGDLIVLPRANFLLPCDCLLLNGECIVNESMLTGESVPVTKTAPHATTEPYNSETHGKHTLFCGTYMTQSRYYGGDNVLARVVKTGYDTKKGALVKCILFPTPVNLKFYHDSMKFILVLLLIAALGSAYCIYVYMIRNAPISEVIIRSLDIITIVVPPALPAAMTVGIIYSQNRLKKLKIFCISPQRINVCGKIKLACFDKTGTLTYGGIEMHSVLPANESGFLEPVIDCGMLDFSSRLVQTMATCHSLTRIGGELNGDPLDLSMFNFTHWEFEEPGNDENARFDMLPPTLVRSPDKQMVQEIGIIRKFPFSSSVQCMSVICRDLNWPTMVAFTKGAPEKVAGMCQFDTLPGDFSDKLTQYTASGYRVIALAYKELPKEQKWLEVQKIRRDIIECDLIFLGLLVMQNALKPETAPVLEILHNANIRTVMITGDYILTAISVARDCGMVKTNDQLSIIEAANGNDDNNGEIPKITLQTIGTPNFNDVAINFDSSHHHFAIDGKTWTKLRTFYPDVLPELLVRTTIFARFEPDQKTQVIEYLQSLDYIVSMVGDGANDCGALKAAHVGVSLSQAEASVAAPFTSSTDNISCILHLILEGRCALVTSFALFKFMALYSFIQFFTVIILYKQHSILGDTQFLYIDLIITTVLAVTIGRQGPWQRLCEKRPTGCLVSPNTLIPLILQILSCGLLQIGALFYLYQQEWFEPVSDDVQDEVVLCWENTTLFTFSCFQYIILACVYSKGLPYRQNLLSNFWFLFSALSLTVFGTYLMIYPSKEIAEFFEIIYLPQRAHDQNVFKYKLLLWPLFHLAIAVFLEVGMADRAWLKKIVHFIRRKKQPKNKYKILLDNNNYRNIFDAQ